MTGYGLAMTMYHRILFETLMKSYISILTYEKNFGIIIHHTYVANCISTGYLRKHAMNALYKISYGLFASVLLTAYFENMTATFLLFTTGVVVLVTAVYLNDLKEK
jgi:hypothetical protein